MTTFALMVQSSPLSSQNATTALNFAKAAIAAGHRVLRVFFFHDGVICGDDRAGYPHNEPATEWKALASEHGIDLVLCAPSALRRGVVDEGQAARLGRQPTATAPFALSGLGQWVEAAAAADRVVTFGV
ncbi:MAG: sulfurtransferase complex subunit TusD [Spongiibacteraceae bacterium]|jgi:tRNA 2-thiouridine synthesizing protein D|nr:sulfurtransferase complex subunit TusD [Spongiibacteraceae bacterium]